VAQQPLPGRYIAVAGGSAPNATDFAVFKLQVQALEQAYYASVGLSQAEADEELFILALDQEKMVDYYENLDPYVPLESYSSDALRNAVISGAGMCLSPSYVSQHAPRLNFGRFGASVFEGLNITDAAVQAMYDGALEEADEWGLISDGLLYKNVMWIDDQITAMYAKQVGAQKQVALEDPSPDAFIPKARPAPSNPAWYTLAIYMPTLLSGFLLYLVVQKSDGPPTQGMAADALSTFKSLFPAGSIGEVYCTFIDASMVHAAMEKAFEEEQYWRTETSPAWAAMVANPVAMAELELIFESRVL